MFQYPLTDRDGCNEKEEGLHAAPDSVSVSSNGSRRLQHLHSLALPLEEAVFQYPLTDRDGCNLL